MAVIAPSFSDIFASNAFKNGILTDALPQTRVEVLLEAAHETPLTIELNSQTVTTVDGYRSEFQIDPFRKHCLLEGPDEIELTLQDLGAIDAFEAKPAVYQHRARLRWAASP